MQEIMPLLKSKNGFHSVRLKFIRFITKELGSSVYDKWKSE